MSSDTIYGFASGIGRAAVGIFRVSGPKAAAVVEALTGSVPQPRYARLTSFIDPLTQEILDRGLVLWFPGPTSFTGEDVAEFQCHGGIAVTAALTKTIGGLDGVRVAEPGEFTRRAFLNGKLDLSAVEGLSDLVEATTQAQRRQALRQVSGILRDRALAWRANLLEAAALIEGEIDFSDEADVPKEILGQVRHLLAPILAALQKELNSKLAERIRQGLIILIAGPPNAGKSTLMNALARRDVAIVSEYAGTTRDLLEVHLDIDDVPVTLIDTAGLRESSDPIEQIGMARARARSKEADLVLWLSEAVTPVPPDPLLAHEDLWVITTKSDLLVSAFETAPLAPPQDEVFSGFAASPPHPGALSKQAFRRMNCEMLSLSAETGENLDVLIDRLSAFARASVLTGEAGLITRARHRAAFQKAEAALTRVVEGVSRPIEFVAEDLRLATRALESLVGGVDVEDVLGEIFSRFCVGK
jgi:tRNA modification GTPase